MRNWLRSIISLVFLAIMLVIAYQQTQAPQAHTDSDLNYEALFDHVTAIAAKPHPIGSDENARVRDYIVRHFESLGLITEVQRTTVVYRHPFKQRNGTIIGNVENIIARLPARPGLGVGQASDLVLMAHYDSRPLTPGAADDAAGAASIMEVARVMAAGPAPLHDVVFLVTDGEEMGLLGAQGFFRQHPAASRVGMVLNFEARGSYGASSMFETSDKNAWLIGNLIESAPDLVASSLSYEIYRRMPNDTDMSISKGEGIAGLNFAFVSGLSDYHAVTDTAENLDKNTLAQQANYALATARHFAMLENWQSADADMTYFNLWQGKLVSYSQSFASGFGLLVLIFGIFVFVYAARNDGLKLPLVGNGLLAIFVLIVVISNLFESMTDYMVAANAGIERLMSLREAPLLAYFITTLGFCAWFAAGIRRKFGLVESLVMIFSLVVITLMFGKSLAVTVLMLLILLPSMLYLRKRTFVPDIWAAALMLWWLMAAVALYFMPNGSYLLIWPLASALLAFALQRRRGAKVADMSAVSAVSFSFIPLLLVGPLVIMAYLALGTTLPQVIMIIVTLALLLIWPLVQNMDASSGGKPGFLLLVTGLLMSLVLVFDRDFDARYPLGQSLFYAYDVDQKTGYWVSPDAEPGSWLGDFLGEHVQEFELSRILPGYDEAALARKHGADDIAPAFIRLISDQMIGAEREVSLRIQSPLEAKYINVLIPLDAGVSGAMVNGMTVNVPVFATKGDVVVKPETDKGRDQGDDSAWWRWRWYGMPASGADIVLKMNPGQGLRLKIIEVDYGLPDGAPQRPVGSAPKPYTWSDSMVLFQTWELN